MSFLKEKIIYVAGASSRAKTAKEYIEFIFTHSRVAAFLVSPEMKDNDDSIGGVPVLPITREVISAYEMDISSPVYIAMRGVNHAKVEAELRKVGFFDIRPIDVFLDTYMRNEYVKRKHEKAGKSFVMIDHLNDGGARDGTIFGKIYVANSAHDSVLKDKYTLKQSEEAIQVGAEITNARIPGIPNLDNDGLDTKNISTLNSQFCELTALYWIWKNTTEDYVGLSHYRRHFILPDNWIRRCDANNADVILPVPLYVYPDLEGDYRKRHVSQDWDVLMDYFKRSLPDEYDMAKEFFAGNLYSPCNMLIARREVLNELCRWLFSILFTVYKRIGDKEDSYQRRYPGFMSERLISYYFDNRRDRYKVAYANKNFLN